MHDVDDIARLFKSFEADPANYTSVNRAPDAAESVGRWSLLSKVEAQARADDELPVHVPEIGVTAKAASSQKSHGTCATLPTSESAPDAVESVSDGYVKSLSEASPDALLAAPTREPPASLIQQEKRSRSPQPTIATTAADGLDSRLYDVFARLAQAPCIVADHPLKKPRFLPQAR